MKIIKPRKFILLNLVVMAVLVGCSDVDPGIESVKTDKGGDLVIKDSYYFKQKKEPEDILTNKGLESVLRRLDQEKVDGVWSTGGEVHLSGGDLSVGMNPNFYSGQGIKSITAEQKAKFMANDPHLAERIRKGGMSLASATTRFPLFKQAAEDPLLTSFDVTSPGSILTPEQWIKHLTKLKGGSKGKMLDFHENGVMVRRHQIDQLEIVVNSIFKASEVMTAKGMPVNPDFLIALSMNETLWGDNKYAKDRNSWFSYGAYNHNPDLAKYFANPYESALFIIEKLTEDYLTEGGPYYIPEKGPTIFGANTRYAKLDEADFPNYSWSVTIGKIIRSACSTNNVNLPNF